MKPGDLVQLARPHNGRRVGEQGVVAKFFRWEPDELVTVHFDGDDENVPHELLVPAYGSKLRLTDQSSSDDDKTSSQRDQASADSDQTASDDDLAAGGDPEVHARSKAARELSRQLRNDIAALRGENTTARRRRSADQ